MHKQLMERLIFLRNMTYAQAADYYGVNEGELRGNRDGGVSLLLYYRVESDVCLHLMARLIDQCTRGEVDHARITLALLRPMSALPSGSVEAAQELVLQTANGEVHG